MWKIIPSLASKFVELHINPLKNLDWFLDPHWVFTNKSQPAATQATSLSGQLARFLRTSSDSCEQALRTYFFSRQVS